MEKRENIDLDEVEKFSSQANDWWNSDGAFKTLHDINPGRLNFVAKHVFLKDSHILDIGCGGGIFAEAMAKQGGIVTGLDASNENIVMASQHASESKLDITYITDTAETHSKNHTNQYDVITCMELLEHVPDPVSIIRACSTMIKPGGHVMFSTINRNLKAYMLAIVTGEYVLNLLPKGTHQYSKFIRPSELISWCKEYGLELNDLKGMNYNPLLKRCSLEKSPDVNYLIDTIAS